MPMLIGKLLGASMVLAAGWLIGLQAASNLARRPGELRDLQSLLQMLETEICYSATPLTEAFRTVARHGRSRVAEIFAEAADVLEAGEGGTAGEALGVALQQVYQKLALERSDAEILLSLGAVLGASDRDDQKKHLALAGERLKREEAAAQEARLRYERLYRYAGALGGAALVLLLI